MDDTGLRVTAWTAALYLVLGVAYMAVIFHVEDRRIRAIVNDAAQLGPLLAAVVVSLAVALGVLLWPFFAVADLIQRVRRG